MPGSPSQNFLTIDRIHDGIVELKSGGLRAVLMCSSLNFALKSTDEQDAIIFGYQDFLNSLEFSLAFVTHSRRLNIAPYLDTLRARAHEEDNELLKLQIGEYVEFVHTFVEMTNIMAKTFYVVIPFDVPIASRIGVFQSMGAAFGTFGAAEKKKAGGFGAQSFEEMKNQLWQRVDAIVAGLQSIGIRAAPLNTEELVELFYGLYNPTEFEKLTVPAEN